MSEVTRILNAIDKGDAEATAKLLPLVYQELRNVARQHMGRERTGHTLQATALVHEAYLRLVGDGQGRWDGRGHFFAAAAEAMRRILIEHARRRKALCHGGGQVPEDIGDGIPDIACGVGTTPDLIDLDDALKRLEQEDPAKAELVKLRYFAGLSVEEAAGILGISRATALRHWSFARAWLYQAINGISQVDAEK